MHVSGVESHSCAQVKMAVPKDDHMIKQASVTGAVEKGNHRTLVMVM